MKTAFIAFFVVFLAACEASPSVNMVEPIPASSEPLPCEQEGRRDDQGRPIPVC